MIRQGKKEGEYRFRYPPSVPYVGPPNYTGLRLLYTHL